MITIQNTSLSFSNMGLFDTSNEWIHPTVTVETYELIFVTDGSVPIREGNTVYRLKQGDMLLLYPHIEHGGVEISHSHTAFYWLHFRTDDISAFPFPKHSTPDAHRTERVMKDMMQCQQKGMPTVAELILGRLLLESTSPVERKNKTAHEIAEYIRIHASHPLSVTEVASRFGYAPDHLSRILRTEFGMSAKALIVEKRLSYIESLLLNTNEPVKEIAYLCGFEDENIFIKFFKYHKHQTPTEFRNEFFRIHMNSR